MQRPPIMRALTMPASDFPYGNTIGLDSPFAPFFFPLFLSFLHLPLYERRKKFRPLSLSPVSLDESLLLFRSSNVY